MNHLEFAALESAALAPTSFEAWAEKVEKILGHDLDGDEREDGYSIDGALKAFRRGQGPVCYASWVQAEEELRARLRGGA